MTPAALTPAAQKAAAKRAAATEPGGSHPRRLRRPAGPSTPRRVSGPINRTVAPPAPRASPSGRPARQAAPAPPARAPRPASGASARPASPRASTARGGGAVVARPRRSRATSRRRVGAATAAHATLGALGRAIPHPRRSSGPLGARLAAGVRTMPNHRLIDRLVRGQAWIPVLGVMLAGIVFMQVEVLKLGAGIGRSVQQASTLSTVNQQLRASVATLGDDQRIESMAAQMGMIMPNPTAVGFLSVPSDAGRVVGSIAAPSATTFLNATSKNGAVALANDLAPTGGSNVGAIAIAPAPGTTGSAAS
ncbi:MAG: hypothetical protein QOG59_1330, partial [Solirubrobacteraceae bacterium]|nr:hypothetical protein [Solirubrobacteraceae bacterium]